MKLSGKKETLNLSDYKLSEQLSRTPCSVQRELRHGFYALSLIVADVGAPKQPFHGEYSSHFSFLTQ